MNEMLLEISKLDFCVNDVCLFLDTHPCDREAMRYYQEACCRLQRLKQAFIQRGGALTNRQCANLNQYINEPFPWDGGENTCGAMKNDCNFQ